MKKMKILNFILILLFYSCICHEQLMNLEINKTSEVNTGDYSETHANKNLEEYNYESSYNTYPIFNSFNDGQIILQKDKIWRSNDSTASKRNFEFEPKEKNTTMATFQIFKCGDASYPNLTITYNS